MGEEPIEGLEEFNHVTAGQIITLLSVLVQELSDLSTHMRSSVDLTKVKADLEGEIVKEMKRERIDFRSELGKVRRDVSLLARRGLIVILLTTTELSMVLWAIVVGANRWGNDVFYAGARVSGLVSGVLVLWLAWDFFRRG